MKSPKDYVNFRTVLDLVNDERFLTDDPFEVASALSEIHSKRKILHTIKNSEPQGYTVFRYLPGIKVFFDNFDQAKKDQKKEIKKSGKKVSITPFDKEYEPACQALGVSIGLYRDFLESCIDGAPNWDLLGLMAFECFSRGIGSVEIWPNPDDRKPFDPFIWLIPDLKSFEDNLEAFGILFYFFNGMGSLFSHIRKCIHCMKFFFPKNPKAMFCTEKCRGRLRYLKKIGKI